MGGAGYAGKAGDWYEACAAAKTTTSAKSFFEQWFSPVEISAAGMPEGRFTGYFEPEISVSRTRRGQFQTPVYGLPDDLVGVDLGDFRASLKGERIAGRLENGRLKPYPARAQIDALGVPAAQVLFYANDPVAVFFLQIQGSGRAAFEDGSIVRVAYAGQNGRPYTAIGATLIAKGELKRDEVSLNSIRDWLKTHSSDAAGVMQTNESYVFFKEEALGDPALGAKGAMQVPLTAGASLAVDTRFHALGVPFFVSTTLPDGTALQNVLVAQDTGGAIRGAVRGDIFFGFGEKAENLAGAMNAIGRLYALLPKSLASRLADNTDCPGPAR